MSKYGFRGKAACVPGPTHDDDQSQARNSCPAAWDEMQLKLEALHCSEFFNSASKRNIDSAFSQARMGAHLQKEPSRNDSSMLGSPMDRSRAILKIRYTANLKRPNTTSCELDVYSLRYLHRRESKISLVSKATRPSAPKIPNACPQTQVCLIWSIETTQRSNIHTPSEACPLDPFNHRQVRRACLSSLFPDPSFRPFFLGGDSRCSTYQSKKIAITIAMRTASKT